jgi:hypothetical protein
MGFGPGFREPAANSFGRSDSTMSLLIQIIEK